MKVIFLDFDGVLNTPKGYWNKDNIKQLNRICDLTGAIVVVSSSWKMSHGVDALRELLINAGFTGLLFGTTPDLRKQTKSGLWLGVDRGVEILAWIKQYAPIKYIAIDDINDPWMEDFLIKTDSSIGLTEELANKAISILNELKIDNQYHGSEVHEKIKNTNMQVNSYFNDLR